MTSFDPNPDAIERRRRLAEAGLTRLLRKAGANFPVGAIQSVVFGYHHTRFKTYLVQLLSLFASLEKPIDEDILLPMIEDAWNYFPHESLNGRSPAELIADQLRKDHTAA